MDLGPGDSIKSYPIRTRRRDPSIMALRSRQLQELAETGSAHRLFIASARPILRARLTASPRLAFPISRRFSLDGFGRLVIHSGTADPDCSSTFAILSKPPRVSAPARQNKRLAVTHGFRNGASSSVKYVTALPSRPARPVRPGPPTRVSQAHSVQAHAHTDRFGECSSALYEESHN